MASVKLMICIMPTDFVYVLRVVMRKKTEIVFGRHFEPMVWYGSPVVLSAVGTENTD